MLFPIVMSTTACGWRERMLDDRINWTALREFSGVDLESSYVLSWSLEGDSLLLDLDVYLLPEHTFYEVPRPSQKACIRAATIEFPYCDSVRTDDGGDDKSPVNAVERLRLGRIDGLAVVADGRYELRGEFGNVQISAERPLLRMKEL